jgi:hypothetical protein
MALAEIALERSAIDQRIIVSGLIVSFLALLSCSLVLVAGDVHPGFNMRFDRANLIPAALSVAVLGLAAPLFASSRSPLGFAASFYLLAITAGYLWLSWFTPLQYNHTAARLSAAASWVAFALPALLITRPIKVRQLSLQQMDRLCAALLAVAAAVAAIGYSLGFRFASMLESEALRATLNFPAWMRYAIPICATAILPFCYAWSITRRRYFMAAVTLAVALSYYPISLNKMTLLAPFWLVALTVLLRLTPWRIAVVLSLLLPAAFGLVTFAINDGGTPLIFRTINFRMLAIPASAIDHYNHFFSTHPLTGFCQISVVAKLFSCALPDHLGVMLAGTYATGNYNASLLATEGIASVGPIFAPLTAFACGLVIAAGGCASSRLDPALVLLSASILLLALMNIPLSTVMVTHGGIALFALWLITPKD